MFPNPWTGEKVRKERTKESSAFHSKEPVWKYLVPTPIINNFQLRIQQQKLGDENYPPVIWYLLLMRAVKTFRTWSKPSRNAAGKVLGSVAETSLTPSDAAGLASEPAQRAKIKAFQPLAHQRRREGQASLSPGECFPRTPLVFCWCSADRNLIGP